ncbi:hypothetical protein CAPTEDRAFT_120424 [Capitella teleta]|uniref:Uncharacterized protein n=1 Tax=Capitella teleta TaxID=283909 RepID=R7TMJ6_CAPTE|nr:hypothetical protein CAPTEDRAFT_120424 [Capitella teleta]|eukprot:ELT95093.1 hypothetical protein CAPTEDRAFT_120424 [Capitella teleta]
MLDQIPAPVFRPEVRHHDLVVAFDLGTTSTTYGFSFKEKPWDISLPSEWGSSVGLSLALKAPNCILTSGQGAFKAFGYDAQQMWCWMSPNESKKFRYFDNFKSQLRSKGLTRDSMVYSTLGHQLPALDALAMTLSYLKKHAQKEVLIQTDLSLDLLAVQWVVTVPAVWSSSSKQLVREAAMRAKLINEVNSNNLILALESEAASLFWRQTNQSLINRYLLIDCGGGTVNFAAHRILADRRIEELVESKGIDVGGDSIDEGFLSLMEQIFGQDVMKNYKEECRTDWLQLKLDFTRAKTSLDPSQPGWRFLVPIASSFAECCRRISGRGLEQLIDARHRNRGVAIAGCNLLLSSHVIRELFDPVVNQIVQHIEEFLEKDPLKTVNKCVMVGGFGECHILQDALKKAFTSRLTFIVPREAGQCVVKGAVLYGHSPDSVAKHRSRKTYGIQVYEKYDPDIHNPDKTIQKDGETIAFPVFHTIITRGEETKSGEVRKFMFKPSSSKVKRIVSPLYETDKLSPVYANEAGVRKIGLITMELPGEGMDREVQCVFTFANSVIQVELSHVVPGKGQGTAAKVSVDFLSELC